MGARLKNQLRIQYFRAMCDHNDAMTETRGSLEERPTFWTSFKAFICPCLIERHDNSSQKNETNPQPPQKHQSNTIYGYNLARSPQTGNRTNNYRKTSDDISDKGSKKEGLLGKEGSGGKKGRRRGEPKEPLGFQLGGHDVAAFTCPVCTYPEDQLISLGINESHLLAKIRRVEFNPAIPPPPKKDPLQSPRRKRNLFQSELTSPEFQKFWRQRYLIFSKFDEGVRMDEGSWNTTPPELVCELVAGKCTGAKVMLDGFAGAGGTAIKLASLGTCVKVIANDWSETKLGCLLNNAKVYQTEANIEINEQDFLTLDKKNIDVVVVQPPFNPSKGKSLSIVDFTPSLAQVLMKCLRLASDVVMLLPAETGIEALCSCLNRCATELKKMRSSCSVHFDKIYFQGELKYLLLTLGPLVQTEIKLNEELDYIYARLKRKTDASFRHRKVIKRIREDHGMLELLNLLKLSESRAKERQGQEDLMDVFCEIIRERQLIPPERLEKLMEEQPSEKKRNSLITSSLSNSLERSKEDKQPKEEKEQSKEASKEGWSKDEKEERLEPVMEEEKVEENDVHYRQSQQTQSESSHYSYLSGLEKAQQGSHLSRLMRLPSDSFSSVIIKRTINGSRQKRDISPQNSPVSPARRNPKNRISQVPDKKELAETKKRAKDL